MATTSTTTHGHGQAQQQHPLSTYLWIWGLLFVLSFFSYLVDYFHLHGMTRWSLILLFMVLKAGLIVAVFMHMMWERLALIYAILLPPILLLIFVALMAMESDYTLITRELFFGPGAEMSAVAYWIGTLLVIAGVVYSAGQVLWRGPLSGGRRLAAGEGPKTLEPPRGRARSLGLAREWPGLMLIALGGVLLLAGAAATYWE